MWTPRRRPAGLAALAVAVAIGVGAAPAAAASNLRVGTATLHRCDGSPGWCGSLPRLLDPADTGGPRVSIHYQWLPASAGRARGTIVAVEGGPGYPSRGSLGEYAGTFAAVRGRDNLLLVDNRGTGGSALIRCPSLDRYPPTARASGTGFAARVGACGDALDARYHDSDGQPVHAADLFGTAYAADDLDAVVRRLGVGRVTLYGDSYGSWFAQAYAARHPDSLRALILDSTYPVRGLDPYYASSGEVARAAMDRVCSRDLGCAAHDGHGSDAVARLGALVAALRRSPVRGTAAGDRITVTPRTLVDLVQDAGSDPLVWRELDASVRAALSGDDAPLLRMADDGSGNGGEADAASFSDGDYMAVSCTDYPQLFSMTAPPAQREAQFATAIDRAPAGAFAPFTAAEWARMSGYSQPYDTCLDWPAPVHAAPPLGSSPRPLPASTPVLIVGGDLDDLTPLSDAQRFGPTLGARVRVVDLRNTVHVTSEGDTFLNLGAACARAVIDDFVSDPGRTSDSRCASQLPHLHTPGAYPRTLGAAAAATVVAGPRLAATSRRAVTVAAGALADATIRQRALGGTAGAGLRGGRFTAHHGRFVLRGVRFVSDATVSGPARYRAADGWTHGTLTVSAGARRTTVALSWDARDERARARVGRTTLTLPAP